MSEWPEGAIVVPLCHHRNRTGGRRWVDLLLWSKVYTLHMEGGFDPDLIRSIFRVVWSSRRRAERNDDYMEVIDVEVGAGASKKYRPATANSNALKVSCELLRIFVTEAVQRAAIIAEAEGLTKIEATHLERILPQLLLDF